MRVESTTNQTGMKTHVGVCVYTTEAEHTCMFCRLVAARVDLLSGLLANGHDGSPLVVRKGELCCEAFLCCLLDGNRRRVKVLWMLFSSGIESPLFGINRPLKTKTTQGQSHAVSLRHHYPSCCQTLAATRINYDVRSHFPAFNNPAGPLMNSGMCCWETNLKSKPSTERLTH